jgi:hypothetical protein
MKLCDDDFIDLWHLCHSFFDDTYLTGEKLDRLRDILATVIPPHRLDAAVQESLTVMKTLPNAVSVVAHLRRWSKGKTHVR